MNLLNKNTLSKLAPEGITLSTRARNALLAVTGASAFLIAKFEMDKQGVKRLIELKKERLQMVKSYIHRSI